MPVLCLRLVLALATFAATAPAIGQVRGVTATDVTIGTLLPLSGPYAAIGAQMSAAIDRAIADINASGGVINRRVKVIKKNTQSSVQVEIKAADELVTVEKVYGLVSSFYSGATGRYIAEKYAILDFFSVSRISPHIEFKKAYPNVFRFSKNNFTFLQRPDLMGL